VGQTPHYDANFRRFLMRRCERLLRHAWCERVDGREEREANKPKHERKGNGRTIQLQCLFVFVKGFISSSFFWPYMLLEQFQELAYILGS
jgi:hypothetical protein